ncbi:hypothetical protein SAMN04487950_2275 [Halogranum rubrum]|uniref:Uncharacterized protein n=1 Tax=Halogranum rubrum TaxID=553466 RepID=A0A1I4EMD1_9EURY|nr:hypothetical protein [Halogranum rubrum]SFL06908.1 hypothetical protein SAMN04487950_2275 [Halogranum rubrum]
MDDSHTGEHDSHDHGGNEEGRITSPMQSFTMSQVGTGIVVTLVGLAVVFGVPLLLA